MWQEVVQIGFGWGAAMALVGFWYWVMRSIGTF